AGLEGRHRDVHQALAGLGLCRHRQSAVLSRQHDDAARRRQEGHREHCQGDVNPSQETMTALKWLLIVVSAGYVCGLVVLFFAQRAFLFPAPTTARTTPRQVGFPEAEEHFLATADGEKIIAWHVPAKPGHPVVLY